MDKLKQLLIRACKSKKPQKRLESLRKRFWLDCSEETVTISALAGICDDYLDITINKVIMGLAPCELAPFRDAITPNHNGRCLSFLIKEIRYSDVKLFPGLTLPARFRD